MINYIENQSRIDKALEAENPQVELEDLVQCLSKEGFKRNQIYQFFLAYQVDNQEKTHWLQIEKTDGDHPIMKLLDRLWGWGNTANTLLNDELIEE